MTRKVRILAAAANEAAEAKFWYELEQPGLGARFEAALNSSLDLLEHEILPLSAWPGSAGRRGVKHVMLRRLPFSLVVPGTAEELVVIAIAHQSKRPGYRLPRLST